MENILERPYYFLLSQLNQAKLKPSWAKTQQLVKNNKINQNGHKLLTKFQLKMQLKLKMRLKLKMKL